jgi:hypothetical protein
VVLLGSAAVLMKYSYQLLGESGHWRLKTLNYRALLRNKTKS